MTHAKICGITNLDDAALAAELECDELGFNFYEKSRRFVTAGTVLEIVTNLKRRVANVGVFVNAELEYILSVSMAARLDRVQLHGDESPNLARSVSEQTGLPVIKAFRIGPNFEWQRIAEYDVDAILLDSYSQGEFGGTGTTFDWSTASDLAASGRKIYLAGGLTPDNVGAAIAAVRPYAVDVCSGVESNPGIKDREKLRQFLLSVKEL